MKVNSRCSNVASTSWSIFNKRKLSFGQASFKSMKSMQIHHFSLAFSHHHDICEPIEIMGFSDEVDSEELVNRFINGFLSFRSEGPFLLSHWPGLWIDI